MQAGSRQYQVRIHEMANQIKTGSLTVIGSKEDYKLLQLTAISIWENQRWTGLVNKYNNKVSMFLCYHRQEQLNLF